MTVLALGPIQVDYDRARAYVLAHGAAREKARLEGIVGAVGPARDVTKALETLQNADGGFPARGVAGNPSSIDATCYTLFQLKDLPPLEGSPMASRAVSYLRRMQLIDGSWQESPEAADLVGPWARPGAPGAATYLTALAVYNILTLEPEHADPISRGVNWLRRAMAQEGEQVPLQTLACAAGAFYKYLGPNAHEASWTVTQIAKRTMDASELAWWLSVALEVAAGGKYLVPVVQGLGALAAMQREDGAFPGEEGFEVEATLTALRVFRGYGVI
ncbi:MAG TPA: prenyltransferase/squalene oxidase repeat-containing protein [Symbiobacteriaceae bacterium]|jgi:hypothetical protein|nr:prenyltransferase/squalene oxidase repeat-containing protein [Symbiobacteriaceae bacterium]